VLRLNPGDELTLFNGNGRAFHATLSEIGKKQALAHVAHVLPDDQTEAPYRVELIQGIASNEKMDWLIEKAVELGVSHIVPVVATRSVVRLSGERAERRQAHWNALCRAACEQSGRNRVPTVAAPVSFEKWLESGQLKKNGANVGGVGGVPTSPLKLLLSPRGILRFGELPATPPHDGIQLLIGPEGGWTETEEDSARQAGWSALSLGARVLRTETAGMALLAALAGRWGGW
jgi:16S rRNA (uracil1498-N3)-methyltransferase